MLSIHVLAVAGSGRSGDALVDQGSAEVVDSCMQTGLHPLHAHLDPGGLDVSDVRMQNQAGHGVNEHGLAEGRPLPGLTATVDGGHLRHERQGYEFCEPASAGLKIAQGQQVMRPVLIAIHMAEHDGGCGIQADSMGRFHDLQPLR